MGKTLSQSGVAVKTPTPDFLGDQAHAAVLSHRQGAVYEVSRRAVGHTAGDKCGPARKQLEQERLGTTELCQSGSAPSPTAQQELCGFFLLFFFSPPFSLYILLLQTDSRSSGAN